MVESLYIDFRDRRDLEIIADMVEPGQRVLDLGCGDGSFLRMLHEKRGADVLGMDIQIAGSSQIPALASAIFAAVAAGSARGGYDSLIEASDAMKNLSDTVYHPNPEAKAVYDRLYAEYTLLHDYFGRGGNDVMKRLRAIRAEAMA